MEMRDLSYKPNRIRRFYRWLEDYRTWERIGWFCVGFAVAVMIVCVGAVL